MNRELDLYTTSDIKTVETYRTTTLHIPEHDIVIHSGNVIWSFVKKYYPNVTSFLVLTGKGINAADGFEFAHIAKKNGAKVIIWQSGPVESFKYPTDLFYRQSLLEGITILKDNPEGVFFDLVVDCLIGTGLSGDTRLEYHKAIQYANSVDIPTLSIDVPSGICANTGRKSEYSIKADKTLTFIASKPGLHIGEGKTHAGDVHLDYLKVVDREFDMIHPVAKLIDHTKVKKPVGYFYLENNTKKVLIFGGDRDLTHDCILCSQVCAIQGGVTVDLAVNPFSVKKIHMCHPELRCHIVESSYDIHHLINAYDVVVIGPSMGKSNWSEMVFHSVVNSEKPMVFCSDALHFVTGPLGKKVVVISNDRSAGKILDCTHQVVIDDRLTCSQNLTSKLEATVILVGNGIIVSDDKHTMVGGPKFNSDLDHMDHLIAGVLGGLMTQIDLQMKSSIVALDTIATAIDLSLKQNNDIAIQHEHVLTALRDLLYSE
ncbi:NAD(P)H-hydrate epimerase [Chlamydiia bacterium]|nr:NAD(P)H-hydrate epimerase [Chlamydiia bacterium]